MIGLPYYLNLFIFEQARGVAVYLKTIDAGFTYMVWLFVIKDTPLTRHNSTQRTSNPIHAAVLFQRLSLEGTLKHIGYSVYRYGRIWI